MRNLFKIKKSKFGLFLLLIFNQFLLNSYAVNLSKISISNSVGNNLHKKNNNPFKTLLVEKKQIKSLEEETNEIEQFLEENFDRNSFKELENKNTNFNSNIDKLEEDSINKELEKNKLLKEEKHIFENSPINKVTENNDLNNNKQKLIPLPARSVISSSEFKLPSRGYVELKGPKISINFKEADVIDALKILSKEGGYGILIIQDKDSKDKDSNEKEESQTQPKITANFEEVDISVAFNSILLSANLQAVVENNIIFVGKNVLNKSLKPKVSKTYRLNQVNAASVADFLSTLGAQISKVMLLSGSIEGSEIGDGLINKREFKDELKDSYGIEGGPLFGVVGAADLRLQTITLIGSGDQMKIAEKYIKSLDIRHRQVALNIKILDVSLSKNDIKENMFEMMSGSTSLIVNEGLAVITGNTGIPKVPLAGSTVTSFRDVTAGPLANNTFETWLNSKITNENAKVLASPTLILGENPNILSSGAAQVDDALNEATIGRPYKNEGFIKVGETVNTSFTQSTADNGTVTCTATEGTAGITFGAKVDKIDDNGFVTFALSPAISSVTKTAVVTNCGIQSTLSVRKLDTGSIRVKNGNTLILTGVLQDSDNITTSKVPILGDIPLLGSLFRSNSNVKKKSELVILVTPRILKDE